MDKQAYFKMMGLTQFGLYKQADLIKQQKRGVLNQIFRFARMTASQKAAAKDLIQKQRRLRAARAQLRNSETINIPGATNAGKAIYDYNTAKQNYRAAKGGSVRVKPGAPTGATTGATTGAPTGASTGATTGAPTGASTGAPTGATTGASTGATRDVWDKVKKPLMVAGGATLGAGGAGTIGYAMGHSTGRQLGSAQTANAMTDKMHNAYNTGYRQGANSVKPQPGFWQRLLDYIQNLFK